MEVFLIICCIVTGLIVYFTMDRKVVDIRRDSIDKQEKLKQENYKLQRELSQLKTEIESTKKELAIDYILKLNVKKYKDFSKNDIKALLEKFAFKTHHNFENTEQNLYQLENDIDLVIECNKSLNAIIKELKNNNILWENDFSIEFCFSDYIPLTSYNQKEILTLIKKVITELKNRKEEKLLQERISSHYKRIREPHFYEYKYYTDEEFYETLINRFGYKALLNSSDEELEHKILQLIKK